MRTEEKQEELQHAENAFTIQCYVGVFVFAYNSFLDHHVDNISTIFGYNAIFVWRTIFAIYIVGYRLFYAIMRTIHVF